MEFQGSTIGVAGDPVIYWAVVPVGMNGDMSTPSEDRARTEAEARRFPGGTLLLGSLLREKLSDQSVVADDIGDFESNTNDPARHHYFCSLGQYQADKFEVVRVSRYSGLRKADTVSYKYGEDQSSAKPEIVIFSDHGLKVGEEWPPFDGAKWIILKLGGSDVRQCRILGKICEMLRDNKGMRDRIIVITSVNALRGAEWEISRNLSWEHSAQDLFVELEQTNGDDVKKYLKQCGRTIVTFNQAGAVLVDNVSDKCHTLFFRTDAMEGKFDGTKKNGHMFGLNSLFTAALAAELYSKRDQGDKEVVRSGILTGMRAMAAAFATGLYDRSSGVTRFPVECMDPDRFLTHRDPVRLGDVKVQRPTASSTWTILDQAFTGWDPIEMAIRVAEDLDALQNVPISSFGKLLTADREEMEALRAVENLIGEYLESKERSREGVKPCSIAVFGPPGSGKSFAVEEVARELQGKDDLDRLVFNLSQFNDVTDLTSALHMVQNECLDGRATPFVFWDEFDTPFGSEYLGWLRHFLAPMQDGKFKRGESEYFIGRCIFVFAGSSCNQYDEFRETVQKQPYGIKGPDFLSRLNGYVDIKGPNPVGSAAEKTSHLAITPNLLITRALIVNHQLTRLAKRRQVSKIAIDKELLRAFLTVSNYRHGARSMRAIFEICRVRGDGLNLSSLPAQTQLNIHVDSEEFLRIARYGQ